MSVENKSKLPEKPVINETWETIKHTAKTSLIGAAGAALLGGLGAFGMEMIATKAAVGAVMSNPWSGIPAALIGGWDAVSNNSSGAIHVATSMTSLAIKGAGLGAAMFAPVGAAAGGLWGFLGANKHIAQMKTEANGMWARAVRAQKEADRAQTMALEENLDIRSRNEEQKQALGIPMAGEDFRGSGLPPLAQGNPRQRGLPDMIG